jgi:hypothetical protein
MNPNQPPFNRSTLEQRMDERLAEAANHRLARVARQRRRKPPRIGRWRTVVGRRLIAAGQIAMTVGGRMVSLGKRIAGEKRVAL